METIQQFINRNMSTYQQHSAVSEETIARYDELFKGKFPKELTWIWRNMGFGVFEDGYLQIVNPEEYTFVFEYIDKLLEPTIIWGITALGDLLLWEGNDNWTIAADEGDRAAFVNIRQPKKNIIGAEVDVYLDILVNDEDDLIDTYKAKPYLEMKGKLPKLHYGQCYGYVPALPLGGKASNNNLQVVDAKSYIQVIGQAIGKIIDLG
ncbi:T6SS immunity protein Tdi1 domain-containing protein [Pedobacter caeni]|uniref:GAD-like domain-containing protein n=1 Tax=Pedobacter caeni TaxID=288992 RepID=A0A1M4VHN6_9SPHI|nr:T6SS immunity protein Tdi1 domain-containing protein [Pedobacter caeni]SHE68489.1 hypothetical protein SAMN04488522_101912 [Pedobacter caeni]